MLIDMQAGPGDPTVAFAFADWVFGPTPQAGPGFTARTVPNLRESILLRAEVGTTISVTGAVQGES